MNSKQVVAAVSVVVLLVILVLPAIWTGTVSVMVQSMKIDKADHVYITINGIWVHQRGQTGAAAWKVVSNQSQSIDLKSFQNSTRFLGKGEVSAATYDSVRIELSNITWVFNKTTTKLFTNSSQLDVNLEFTVSAGKESSVTVILGGHQEVIGSTKFFAPSVNATLNATP